jgi:hypothetical protein
MLLLIAVSFDAKRRLREQLGEGVAATERRLNGETAPLAVSCRRRGRRFVFVLRDNSSEVRANGGGW